MLKNSSLLNSQQGFAVGAVLIGLVVIAVVSFTGFAVYQTSTMNSVQSQSTAAGEIKLKPKTAAGVTYKPLEKNDVKKLQAAAQASSQESDQTASSEAAPVASALTPYAATDVPSAPAAASGSASLTISEDGCTVTATDAAGMTLEVGAFTPHKGGSTTIIVPASGTISTSTGGYMDMTGYGQLTSSGGTKGGYTSATITADSCAPAG